MDEFGWIARHLAPLAGQGSFGLRDDAALIETPSTALVVTQDTIIEGVHFLSGDPLDTVARKALRVNVSDCLAKGAAPFAYSLALAIPPWFREEDMAAFCAGLAADQRAFSLSLSGGDTTRHPERLAISVTMLATPVSHYRSRLDAQPGDVVCVTGTVGDAAIGLLLLNGQLARFEGDDRFVDAYRIPQVPFGIETCLGDAHAAMDISDGLMGDARKLAEASGVSITLERERVPLADPQVLQRHPHLWEAVLDGGDDYQTLFTLPPDAVAATVARAARLGIAVTRVGTCGTMGEHAISLITDGVAKESAYTGYRHT